jgi:hypothetical protein
MERMASPRAIIFHSPRLSTRMHDTALAGGPEGIHWTRAAPGRLPAARRQIANTQHLLDMAQCLAPQ